MKTISKLSGWFLQQTPRAKLMIGGVGLIFLLALCGIMYAVFNSANKASGLPATPTSQGADILAIMTWTPAFAGSATPTNSATPTSTPVLTRTPLPTSLPTQGLETATLVVLPTYVRPVAGTGLVIIIGVDKKLEFVDIKNLSSAPVSLYGWVLVSERGEQSCKLNGILQADAVLRIWAGTNDTGYSCGFLRTIWSDNELDPAVLYNRQGEEVSRYPQSTEP